MSSDTAQAANGATTDDGSTVAREVVDALRIMLNGRNLDADEALALGMIDEVVAGHESALARAAALAREYVATGRGPLAEHFAARRELRAAWDSPRGLSVEDLERHPEIGALLDQARFAGREKAARRVLEAVKTGYAEGFSAGLKHEAATFAAAVADVEGGQTGIQAFLDKKSEPLPLRPRFQPTPEEERDLIATGELLPMYAPFFPGVTPIPSYQYAQAVVKDPKTGAAIHGDPRDVEHQIIVPVKTPGPNDVLLYILVSEVNFNDIWALTGIPISTFDDHDQDFHITGSGGVGLVAAIGSEVKQEGRIQVGDLVSIYSGQSDLLSPIAGLDPMYADFNIQGYQGPNGSHQQFMLAQPPQIHGKLQDLTLEAAGSYILNLGTVYRALFTTLAIEPGKTLFVEGAATGTGLEALKSAARNQVAVTGMVSSVERAEYIKGEGATGVINRRDPRYAGVFTKVPTDPAGWAAWEKAGDVLLADYRAQNDGRLADYSVSHAGELSFPRSFQLLDAGGTLTFFGASSGYHFTFMGKPGAIAATEILRRAGLRAGQAVLIYYGTNTDASGIVDDFGIEAIESVREMGARIVVAALTDAQKEFVLSLGFGDSVRGVVSIEEIKRRFGDDFDWPNGMPEFPDPKAETEKFKEAVRLFNELTFKPFGSAVGSALRSSDNPRGYPDLIFERAGHDALGVSTSLVKPYTGRVVYAEEMSGRRYSFYAPQVWMRQRRIYMPTANIFGTHLCNAYEVTVMNGLISAGLLEVTPPVVVDWDALPEAHQAMWENRHAGATYVVNHALPEPGLKTKEELFEAWAARIQQARGETAETIDTGSSEAFR